jgi:hypothetical protein
MKVKTDTLRGILAGSSSNYDTTNAVASGYVLPTASTTNVLTGGTASANDVSLGAASNLVDGNIATSWQVTGTRHQAHGGVTI